MNHLNETSGTFASFDGGRLFYRVWQPAQPNGRAVLVLHRGHEHSGRVAGLVRDLQEEGLSYFSYDMRGHGRSEGERGYAECYDVWVKDLNAFANHVRDQHGIAIEDMAVVANSVGAVNAVAWVHDYGVPVRALVLAAPAFKIRLYVPLAIPLLRLLHRVNRKAFVTSYVRSRMLTHDAAEAAAYDADPLITKKISVSVLLGLHDTARRLLSDAGAVTVPVLCFTAGSDYVVDQRAHARFMAALSSHRTEHVAFPGRFHAVFSETNRREAAAQAREFLRACFREDPVSGLVKADQAGYTKREYDRLAGPPCVFKRVLFGVQVGAMKTVGRLSRGIWLGWRTGFNSGASLDHVYRNRAEGSTLPGRLMDRAYLNAIGWRGIRLRKVQLKHWVERAAQRVAAAGRPVRIMDVASGPGRYLLELVRERGNHTSLRLRDLDPENIEAARRLAAEWGLAHVECETADAFDAAAYARLEPRPNIAVVSGLYELVPDNGRVLASLRAVAGALEPGGYLVYTGQPWHPQLEMIARTLTGSDGRPWVMRRRTQAELNALVAKAGFRRVDSVIDHFGIFTVTLARKEDA